MLYQPLERSGILTYQLSSEREVYKFAYPLLRENVHKRTLLLLSGGKTVLNLYRLISEFATIVPGAVVMIDEIFGPPFHYKSHELDIRESKLIDHFSKKGVPFFRILSRSASAEATVRIYESYLRQLYQDYEHKVAILELHPDAHIAGLLPNREDWSNPVLGEKKRLVATLEDANRPVDMRQIITLTFAGLARIDTFLVLAVGEERRRALSSLFRVNKRRLARVPAAFLQNRASCRVHLITDQEL